MTAPLPKPAEIIAEYELLEVEAGGYANAEVDALIRYVAGLMGCDVTYVADVMKRHWAGMAG